MYQRPHQLRHTGQRLYMSTSLESCPRPSALRETQGSQRRWHLTPRTPGPPAQAAGGTGSLTWAGGRTAAGQGSPHRYTPSTCTPERVPKNTATQNPVRECPQNNTLHSGSGDPTAPHDMHPTDEPYKPRAQRAPVEGAAEALPDSTCAQCPEQTCVEKDSGPTAPRQGRWLG